MRPSKSPHKTFDGEEELKLQRREEVRKVEDLENYFKNEDSN